ncbi:FadR/GntR family transcriptional regulator [Aneurinibacillus sp. Ricciae_BoGa-3]|uniref:FadR/GntR family transcriptional regulator n=1 Tax=Aneurinibacillus sp. Ricciae_BoGa-3 TaxID=3022697 RepID=UPI0023423E47|nr:FadR/GntR family transcriptional regulator [Aneurinibacillus sp. Ricciae_BoGa-3]WCK53730.1 FadR/GntR family transcriptional regulator [Aneurinibacillus sp. Ricciae_BoGa-3]
MSMPTNQKKASVEVANEIKRRIMNNEFTVGSRLPAERVLAEEFQTSRSTVREALRALEINGIIESKVGQGTYVKKSDFSNEDKILKIANQTSPYEIFDAMFAIEPYLATLAALNATEEEFLSLQTCLQKMEMAIGDIDQFEKLDADFHYQVACAAKNSLLLNFADILNKVRLERLWGTLKIRSLSKQNMELYYRQHVLVYEAIKERDISKATEFTIQHLRMARKNTLGE